MCNHFYFTWGLMLMLDLLCVEKNTSSCSSLFTQFFRKFHAAYVDAVSNPFHVPGKKIASRSFGARVSTIVKSFGSGTTSWSNATFVRLPVIKHICSPCLTELLPTVYCLYGERDASLILIAEQRKIVVHSFKHCAFSCSVHLTCDPSCVVTLHGLPVAVTTHNLSTSL